MPGCAQFDFIKTYMPGHLIIDAIDFARNAGVHHGKISISELGRLQDYLVGNCGELKYTVAGTLSKSAKPVLQITVQGPINLQCQRCLGELKHVLDVRTDLLLASNESELCRFDEDESIDVILARSDMDVLALIEDEIILSLPISPRHRESECAIIKAGSGDTAGKKTPFSALAHLKKLH